MQATEATAKGAPILELQPKAATLSEHHVYEATAGLLTKAASAPWRMFEGGVAITVEEVCRLAPPGTHMFALLRGGIHHARICRPAQKSCS